MKEKKLVGPLSQSALFTLKLGPKIHKALPLCMRCIEAVIETVAEFGMTDSTEALPLSLFLFAQHTFVLL